MLVLTRKNRESIVVAQSGVVVTVLEIRRGKVRLGISAPEGVRVYRQEIWNRIRQSRATPEEEGAVAEPQLSERA